MGKTNIDTGQRSIVTRSKVNILSVITGRYQINDLLGCFILYLGQVILLKPGQRSIVAGYCYVR